MTTAKASLSIQLLIDEDLKRKVAKSEETMAKVCHSMTFLWKHQVVLLFSMCSVLSLSFHSPYLAKDPTKRLLLTQFRTEKKLFEIAA